MLVRWLVVFVAACSLEPVDFRDHPCPCAQGFVCEPCSNTCVRELASDPDARVTIADFRAAWATPHWIRWEFTPSAPDNTSLSRYDLVIAESMDDLESGRATCIGPDRNPELRGYVLESGTGGVDVVTSTFSYPHEPATAYVAYLVATDTASRRFRSNVGSITTAPAPEEDRIVLVDETLPAGAFTHPPAECFAWASGTGAHSGERYYERRHVCPAAGPDNSCDEPAGPAPACWVNFDTQGLALDASSRAEPGPFSRTYLEIGIAAADSEPSDWSQLGLQLAPEGTAPSTGGTLIPMLGGVTIPATGDYVVFEIKLDRLVDGERALQGSDLADLRIHGYRVGGFFARGATLRLDSIALRWWP
jgi:hypothetical protein